MKKKVIALIMIIPLIFLITLFSVGTVASILGDIPVSGIKITTQNEDGFINLDIAEYNANPTNAIYMTAQVEPANAKNKNYSFKVEEAEEGVEIADVLVDEESGKLLLNGTGKAKITAVSQDKGFTDSVTVSVHSSKVLNVVPALKQYVGTSENNITLNKEGESAYSVEMIAGNYQFSGNIYPTNLSDSSLSWTSSNPNVVTVNPVTGKAQAKLSGEATITLDCENAVETFTPVTIRVTVPYQGGASGMTVEGLVNTELKFNTGDNQVSFLIELENGVGEGMTPQIVIDGAHAFYVIGERTFEPLDNVGKRYLVTLTLSNGHPAKIDLTLKIDGMSDVNEISLLFTDFEFNIYTQSHTSKDDDMYQKRDTTLEYAAVYEPESAQVIFEWTVDRDGILITPRNSGLYAKINAVSAGDYTLTVTAYKKVMNGAVAVKGDKLYEETKYIHVVQGVYSVEFIANGKQNGYGIENLLTIGDVKLEDASSGYITSYQYALPLKVNGENVGFNLQDFELISSNVSLLEPAYGVSPETRILGSGEVTLTAKWKYGDIFNSEVKTSIKLRVIKDGVMIGLDSADNTTNYLALKRATNDAKKVILMTDVMLGWENMNKTELRANAYTMQTDYDWAYYYNMYHSYDSNPASRPEMYAQERPSVYYLMEFKNDLYGNGYMINADNFTRAQDSVGNPLLFQGPLNFVAIQTASVKAQDNISFLVRNKGVTINNVTLQGCLNSSIVSDDGTGIDLTKLNNVGTTLELSADTTLVNSRVSNGRTVVRIFGGEVLEGNKTKVENPEEVNLSEHRLFAHIESCILEQAREFILKIGSNLSVYIPPKTDWIYYAPERFKDSIGLPYSVYAHEENLSDQEFYDKYVITDVTLKNSILATSGLFTVGMESHFAGPMLSNMNDVFKDSAGTSFASILRLEGDVKLYDWKDLNKVDSSTLIETSSGAKEFFTLKIDKMLEKVVSVKPEYAQLIQTIGDKKYVHGGIAFYGGGYNYSCLDTSGFTGEMMDEYHVALNILAVGEEFGSDLWNQGETLPAAAGENPFSFFMYDANSNFDYEKQQEVLSSSEAYKLPIAQISAHQ